MTQPPLPIQPDLIERLERAESMLTEEGYPVSAAAVDEAATAITTLQSQLERVKEALTDIRNSILCPVGPSPTLDEVERIASKALDEVDGVGRRD